MSTTAPRPYPYSAGKPPVVELKALDEARRHEASDAVLAERHREQRDAVDDVEHVAVGSARVHPEAERVVDDPGLRREHVGERLGLAPRQRLNRLAGEDRDARARAVGRRHPRSRDLDLLGLVARATAGHATSHAEPAQRAALARRLRITGTPLAGPVRAGVRGRVLRWRAPRFGRRIAAVGADPGPPGSGVRASRVGVRPEPARRRRAGEGEAHEEK